MKQTLLCAALMAGIVLVSHLPTIHSIPSVSAMLDDVYTHSNLAHVLHQASEAAEGK